MGLLGRRLDRIQVRDEFRHGLKMQRDDVEWQRKRVIADEKRDDRAREQRLKLVAQQNTARQKAEDAAEKDAARAEKEAWSRPITRYSGGTSSTDRSLAEPWIVTHHAAPAPVAVLPPLGAGAPPVVNAAHVLLDTDPQLRDDAEWISSVGKPVNKLYKTVDQRYGRLLSKLRDHRWWREVCTASGVCLSRTVDEPWQSRRAAGTRKVTLHDLPSVIGLRIAEDGLRIRVGARVGDTPERWSKALPALRSAFKAAGANADRLRIEEDKGGNIVMVFDDAPSAFPAAVCIEPPQSVAQSVSDARRRYEGAAWTLGVDAKGKAVQYALDDFPHALVVGGTGAGKSVWARGVIEMFRTGYADPSSGKDTAGGFSCFVSSGKITDFVTLQGLPGVTMVAGDAAQTAVMVRMVREEAERRYALAADAKLRGDHTAFDFQPLLLLMDEWGATILSLSKYKSTSSFETDVDIILRIGREAGVHVVLLSQTIRKTGAGAVPGSWQANLGLTVSLGQPEMETLNNTAVFPSGTRDRAESLGHRIAGKKGRGMVSVSGSLTEFQSYYVWSPGTTSLDPKADKKVRPPTPEVAAAWERWQPVSASAPWIGPRLGIKALDPAWSSGTDLAAVAATPVVPITDRAGR
ncbi:MAG: cell division protein FtsK, partial [Gordonia amarae]